MENKELAIGLMSGTSADGLTISLNEINLKKRRLRVLKHKNYLYEPGFRKKLMSAPEMTVSRLSGLNFEIGVLYARILKSFLKESGITPSRIKVVGSHGQTVVHEPFSRDSNTLQIGEPSFMAVKTGIPVVSDFRPADMAAGGQGAPLASFLDEFLFGGGEPVLLVNIGGIANATLTGKGVKTYGFDTGPGNCLMDDFVFRATGGKRSYDKGGRMASLGRIDFKKAERMYGSVPYFRKKPPKSLDRRCFSLDFAGSFFDFSAEKKEDIIATLNYFTALTVRRACSKFIKRRFEAVVISGGGVYNKTLLANLRTLFSGIPVESIEKRGINPLAKESACFALLALLALKRMDNHPFRATGAKRKALLGKIVYPGAAPAR